MRAQGRVPFGHPVDGEGRATASWRAMVGLAPRAGYDRHAWEDGEEFEPISEGAGLIHLVAAMDITVGSMAYKLSAEENHYVTVRGGKIVDFQGRDRR